MYRQEAINRISQEIKNEKMKEEVKTPIELKPSFVVNGVIPPQNKAKQKPNEDKSPKVDKVVVKSPSAKDIQTPGMKKQSSDIQKKKDETPKDSGIEKKEAASESRPLSAVKKGNPLAGRVILGANF